MKQIVVASASAEGGTNDAFVRVEQIDYKKGIKAKLRIHVQTPDGPKEKTVTVKSGADLYMLSNERACYQNGFEIAEINAEPGNEYIRFSNGSNYGKAQNRAASRGRMADPDQAHRQKTSGKGAAAP